MHLRLHTATVALAVTICGVAMSGIANECASQSVVPTISWPQHTMNRPQPPVVDPGPPADPAPAPSDAIVLFDGHDLSHWRSSDGGPARWTVKDGYFEVAPGSGAISTAQGFGDCQLHVEWATPTPATGEGQERGNSGVFLMGMYEVQVLDSYHNITYPDGQAAAVFGQYPPLVNASRAPGEWQSYDIIFHRPRFDAHGAVLQPARMTILHNGVLVQDDVALTGPTAYQQRPPYKAHPDRLPIMLQDHSYRVRYRNIWVRELQSRVVSRESRVNLADHRELRAPGAGLATHDSRLAPDHNPPQPPFLHLPMQLSPRDTYDVCIVGSGAGGGMAAYMLTRAGAKVALIEAGPLWYSTHDSAMLRWPYQSPRRGASTKEKPFGEFDGCIGGWEIDGEPYTTAPGSEFAWWRARMLGGRTNHWGRISLRFGPDDFRHKSVDGLGDDWPISYDDLKPYYDDVDRLIGVFGSNEGLHNHPDGIFLPPPKPRCYELLIKQAADKLGVTCIPSRLSILTRPLNGRAPCHYCGQCNRGCMTNSNFSSPAVLIAPALETRRLTILPNSMAREVTVDKAGLASGVSYIDKATAEERHVSARIVVLAASACESARLLLNSRSSRFPNGLANSSGVVGKYITDTTGTDVAGFIPKMMDHVPHNEDGVGGMHLYMPWWLDNKTLDFPRGYHIELWGGLGVPSYGFMGGIQRYPSGGGYGAQLKEDYRRYYGATVGFSGRGEMIPNEDSYCEIDPHTVDRWGIPVLRFHWKWSDHERKQVKHMQETFRAIVAEMGGEVFSPMPSEKDGYGISTGGSIIHEVGGVRMGNDPNTSALNAHCQAHEVKNLFVADGGPFVTQADKNPTWTILALSMRTSAYIADQRKKGAV